MTDKTAEKEMVHLTLDISPALDSLLEEIAVKTGGTKSDVLRKAIVLMKVAVDARQHGLKVGLAEKGQPLVTEIVGLCNPETARV